MHLLTKSFFMYRLHDWWTAKSWCFTMRFVLLRYRLSFIYNYWPLVKHIDGYHHRKSRRDRDDMVIELTTTDAISACSWWGILDRTWCDQVYKWLAAGRWFSQGTLVIPTNKTESNDITLDIVQSEVKHHNSNLLCHDE
jgi:hypothetical protein